MTKRGRPKLNKQDRKRSMSLSCGEPLRQALTRRARRSAERDRSAYIVRMLTDAVFAADEIKQVVAAMMKEGRR